MRGCPTGSAIGRITACVKVLISHTTMAVDIQKLITSLRAKREAERLDLRACGQKIRIGFSTLARVERGEREPDNNSIIKILHWLHPEPGIRD